MKKYIGYSDIVNLPIKKGHEVTIPVGVYIRSMHPTVGTGPNKRERQVVVHHILPGCDVPIVDALRYHKESLERMGVDPEALEQSVRNGERQWSDMIPVSNPKVVWAGNAGYWSEVDINDILAANKLDLPDEAEESRPGMKF